MGRYLCATVGRNRTHLIVRISFAAPAASIDARWYKTLFATDALIRSKHTSPRGNPKQQALYFMNDAVGALSPAEFW